MATPTLSYETPAPPPPKGALRIIFFIVFMDLLGFGVIIPLMPIYARQFQASPLEVTMLFAIYSACQFIASPILGAASDRFGRRPVLILSQIGSALGYLLLGVVTMHPWHVAKMGLWLVYLSRVIDGLSGGNISTAQAYIADVTTTQRLAAGYLPIPSVEWRAARFTLTVSAVAERTAAGEGLWARYRLGNRTRQPLHLRLALAARPFQVNPAAQFLTTPGGVSAIERVAWDGHGLRLNGAWTIVPLRAPSVARVLDFDSQAIPDRLPWQRPTMTKPTATNGKTEGPNPSYGNYSGIRSGARTSGHSSSVCAQTS